jgi:hypothetical protein
MNKLQLEKMQVHYENTLQLNNLIIKYIFIKLLDAFVIALAFNVIQAIKCVLFKRKDIQYIWNILNYILTTVQLYVLFFVHMYIHISLGQKQLSFSDIIII